MGTNLTAEEYRRLVSVARLAADDKLTARARKYLFDTLKEQGSSRDVLRLAEKVLSPKPRSQGGGEGRVALVRAAAGHRG